MLLYIWHTLRVQFSTYDDNRQVNISLPGLVSCNHIPTVKVSPLRGFRLAGPSLTLPVLVITS